MTQSMIPNEKEVRAMMDKVRMGIPVDNRAAMRGLVYMGAIARKMTPAEALGYVEKADAEMEGKEVCFEVEMV